MTKIYNILIILIYFSGSLTAQNKTDNKWKLSANIGVAFPQNDFKISDNSYEILCIATVGHAIKVQGELQVFNNWKLNIGISEYKTGMNNQKSIEITAKNISDEGYYVNISHQTDPYYVNTLFHIGIIKTFQFGKISISPNFSTGISDFQLDHQVHFNLKKTGSNYTQTIEYYISFEDKIFNSTAVTLNPNLCISYDFYNFNRSSKLGFSFTTEYLLHKAKFVFTKETYDIYGIKTFDYNDFKERISLFNIYFGLYIRL